MIEATDGDSGGMRETDKTSQTAQATVMAYRSPTESSRLKRNQPSLADFELEKKSP